MAGTRGSDMVTEASILIRGEDSDVVPIIADTISQYYLSNPPVSNILTLIIAIVCLYDELEVDKVLTETASHYHWIHRISS